MSRGKGQGQALSLFDHWRIDLCVKIKAAVKAARGLDAISASGTTPAEAELSRLLVVAFEKAGTIEPLVRAYGVEEVFDKPLRPLTEEQRRPALT